MLIRVSKELRKLASSLLNAGIELELDRPQGVQDYSDVPFPPSVEEGGSKEYSTNTEPRALTLDPDSHRERPHKTSPKIKPKRRKPFNESDTRGYRNEYQKEYRIENGNGYIKKPKSDSQEK